MKRALILAGGGMKVAWQAGVLQVLLDEAEQKFDMYDGASAGVFQLAMLCQGMSGRQIADNWRNMRPFDAVSINWLEILKLGFGESLFTLAGLRTKVFRAWGLDFERIRTSALDATFNLYNFTDQRLEVLHPSELTEDLLAACVSLPMWFPSMVINGKRYIDAVYVTDANLEEAIRRGADELWVIWTVSRLSDWQPGFIATYFQVIESAANGRFNAVRARIDANNANIAAGRPGEFGRPIKLCEITGEVPLQYLINASSNRFKQSVGMGVEAARKWCENNGVALVNPRAAHSDPTTNLWFTETMHGFVADAQRNDDFRFRLTITIADLFDFVQRDGGVGVAGGTIDSARFGQKLPVEEGRFNLFVDQSTAPGGGPNPTDKRMLYRLKFRDRDNKQLTMTGYKLIRVAPGQRLWHDTTTLQVKILEGWIDEPDEPSAKIIATGVLRQTPRDFAAQMTTFRAKGPRRFDGLRAVMQFCIYFCGGLWDVYGRRFMKYGPY